MKIEDFEAKKYSKIIALKDKGNNKSKIILNANNTTFYLVEFDKVCDQSHGQRCDFVLYKNDKNVAVASTRNIAVKKANGQYLAFLDSDDLWRSDKLEKQLQLMENTGCSFCYGMCGVIDNEGKNINKDRIVPRSIDFE